WCRTRLSWSDSEWQRVIFSDESRFSLGGDAQRIRGWRHRGQHQDGRFVVTRPEDLVSLHLHPYRTICRNCETALDFKSLRAKFQEEIQLKERPLVPHKPRRFPHPAGGATSSLINISSSGEDHNSSASSAVLRDDRKVMHAKRPVSVPSSFFHHGNDSGSGVARLAFKDRQLPLVLPVAYVQEPKHDPVVSSIKLVTSPIKCKKKAMPTPFKPTKFSKCIKDIIEGAGEHAVHRPPPTESTVTGANGFSHQNGCSDCGSPCPSPEQSLTPPPTAENSLTGGGATHVLSTLEKAKKKFSPKNLLVYARPKSFYASKCSPESPPPSADYENVHHKAEASSWQSRCHPVNSSSYISPPLLQANGFTHQTVFHVSAEVKPAMPDVCPVPTRRPLPDLSSLGPSPMKPPRPPQVNLSSYTQAWACELMTEILSTKLAKCPDNIAADVMGLGSPAVPPPPEFDAPEFPDFEASVLEALNSNLINLAALELEATEFGTPPLDNLPEPEEANDMDPQNCQKYEETIPENIVNPAEAVAVALRRSACPENWADSQSSTALQAEAFKPLASEISMNGAHHVQTDSNSSELPSEPSLSQPGDLYEACDNVYEEVETITKLHFVQNSRKRKGPPKNPYADSPVRNIIGRCFLCCCLSNVCLESVRKERSSPEHHDEKELRKREKQRLEREKKEQKEREKKENEMKKRFKITGQEEPMYHARVLVASKLRKHDLSVKSGDTVSIIRTTNCPKGKWLARDAQHKYGYISVMNVELNMKEMLELGKRAQTTGRGAGEADTLSVSSRCRTELPLFLVLGTGLAKCVKEMKTQADCNRFAIRFHNNVELHFGHVTLTVLDPLYTKFRRCHHTITQFSQAVSLMIVKSGLGMKRPCPLYQKACELHFYSFACKLHEALQKLAVFFQNSREDLSAVTEPSHPNTAKYSILTMVLHFTGADASKHA
ncbi:hypothetical protein NFI96_016194, partial [Prochilodus magdalenae]